MTIFNSAINDQTQEEFDKMMEDVQKHVDNYIKHNKKFPVNMKVIVDSKKDSSMIYIRASKNKYKGSVVLVKRNISEVKVRQALRGLQLEYYSKIGEFV